MEIIDSVEPILLDFVKESTKHFDDSHNHVHALQVTGNAHIIMATLMSDYDARILSYTAMLHDVCDHKYPESIPRSELVEFIKKNLTTVDSDIIMKIIDNISFSKENKGLTETLPEPYNVYLMAIADADRLEAIGEVGVRRCIEFTSSHGGKVPEDVVKHCHEKLLRLLPENFIKSKKAKEMAEPLHEVIVKYVQDNSK